MRGPIPQAEKKAADANRSRIMKGGQKPAPIRRTYKSADGRRIEIAGNARRVFWQGSPALLISWVVLGEVPEALVDAGKYAENEPVLDRSLRRRQAFLSLSPREQEIATLVADGYSTLNIATILDISESTVRTQIKSVYRKTDTHSRAELTGFVLGA